VTSSVFLNDKRLNKDEADTLVNIQLKPSYKEPISSTKYRAVLTDNFIIYTEEF